MEKDIINIGKIPADMRFNYKRSLQLLIDAKNKNKCWEDMSDEHRKIVREIEEKMNITNKIENYNPTEWKFTIDENYNFWLMSNEYVEKHFINKGDE